ncbi:MAG: hypothetical protein JO341_11580 [Gammaproteobacteria bacterium]|nr:hypothetical protein [Gammaproteobacteria bacterium]MBV9621647.1 hypothetical protein [Gammaproteobacteria bacterium]
MNEPVPPLTPLAAPPQVDDSLLTYTHIIYALHALAVLIGLSTAHTIVGSFVMGLPSIVAVIMNYARRAATEGTFLASHFRWQIRTFWYAALWWLVIVCVGWPLVFLIVGIPLVIFGWIALSIWIAYRVIRGWLALHDRRPMYV